MLTKEEKRQNLNYRPKHVHRCCPYTSITWYRDTTGLPLCSLKRYYHLYSEKYQWPLKSGNLLPAGADDVITCENGLLYWSSTAMIAVLVTSYHATSTAKTLVKLEFRCSKHRGPERLLGGVSRE